MMKKKGGVTTLPEEWSFFWKRRRERGRGKERRQLGFVLFLLSVELDSVVIGFEEGGGGEKC